MKGPKLYGIYTAEFPFLDMDEGKVRPVIALSEPKGRYNVIAVVPVSARSQALDVDVKLQDWKRGNLLRPSVARVHRLTTMLQSDLIAELGTLSDADIQTLKANLRKFLEL